MKKEFKTEIKCQAIYSPQRGWTGFITLYELHTPKEAKIWSEKLNQPIPLRRKLWSLSAHSIRFSFNDALEDAINEANYQAAGQQGLTIKITRQKRREAPSAL